MQVILDMDTYRSLDVAKRAAQDHYMNCSSDDRWDAYLALRDAEDRFNDFLRGTQN